MKAPPSQISSWCRSTYQCLISSQMALDHDYKFCFAVNLMSAHSAQCLIFKPTVACLLFIFSAQLDSFLVSASLHTSDAAGHNRIYLRAGLDHLPGHRGKQEAPGDRLLTCSKAEAEVFNGFHVGLRSLKNITTSCICLKWSILQIEAT